ncbi:DNA-directed DNA polymerase [Methylobacterium sp. 4-46]|uniref:DNA polymerase III subunit n=1 Tax=unclassified Methylobacterium TaxID=2615210 RepID=UPI000152E611|nr:MULTISPECIES: AAA family ATPase [Methylobacterium]ACA16012.1 DNA-directed DNA polymerase [Methylobacterium sp. 4-46]WFT81726.1 AAA family ATPase [Methylobacterium nodulans]
MPDTQEPKGWDEKYRPRVFGDLVGQDGAVAWCKERVRERQVKTLLLHGPSGCGKTTIARVLGNALNCRAPVDGSPCLSCDICREFKPKNDTYYREHLCASQGGLEDARMLVRASSASGSRKYRKIFALDEAHRMTGAAFDALLSRLEEPNSTTVFMLLTTDLEAIPEAVLTRSLRIEIRPISDEDALTYLNKICRHEGLEPEAAALQLLVETGRGSPRRLIRDLERVKDFGSLTYDGVRRALDLDHADVVPAYLKVALTGGPLEQQLRLLEGWVTAPERKIRLVEELLVYLLFNEVHRVERSHAIHDRVSVTDRRVLVEALTARAAAARTDVPSFIERLAELWRSSTARQASASDLALLISRFHGYLGPLPVPSEARGAAGPGVTTDSLMKRPRRARAQTPAKAIGAGTVAEHLTYAQACVLWDAASFMAQEFGVWFNMRVTIRHVEGRIGDRTAAEIVGTLLQRLSMKLRGRGAWHWIYVHEFAPRGRTDILLHVLDEQRVEVRRWLLDNFRRGHLPPGDSRTLRVGRLLNLPEARHHRLHFRYMRYLCRGLDPDCMARDERGREGAVLDLLRVLARWRRSIGTVPPGGRRFWVSEGIGEGAQRRCDEERMTFLSALRDHAWRHVAFGWEEREHQDRERERERRAAALARLAIDKAAAPGAILAKARDELRDSWPLDARARKRRWRGWWTRGAAGAKG